MKYVLECCTQRNSTDKQSPIMAIAFKACDRKKSNFCYAICYKKPVILESEMLHFQVHFNSGDNMSIFILRLVHPSVFNAPGEFRIE